MQERAQGGMIIDFSVVQWMFIVASFLYVFLACIVLYADPRATLNRLFAGLTLAGGLWLLFHFLSIHPALTHYGLLSIRVSLYWAVVVNLLYLLFAWELPPRSGKPHTVWMVLLGIATIFVMLTMLSPYAVIGVTVVAGKVVPHMGAGMGVFGLFAVAMNLAQVFLLTRKILHGTSVTRPPSLVILFGTLLMFGLIIGTILIPVTLFHTTAFVDFLPFYMLIFLGFSAYAIIEQKMFHIKIVATATVVVILWIVLIAKVLTDTTASARVLDGIIFVALLPIGLWLIKSVRVEVQRRYQMETLATDLATVNQQLEELSEMKSNFVSIASHQLRAPIGGVRGYLVLLQEGDFGDLPKEVKEIVNNCIDQLDRLLHVINMFLDVTKVESGKMELTKAPADLVDIASHAVGDNLLFAKQKKLTLTGELPKTPVIATVDAAKMREVMFNFIENAIKYTQEGSVTVSLVVEKNEAVFRVRDTGVGIVKEEVPKLFAKFVRAGGGFKVAHGSGLGLYIAKTMTEQHGGSVFVESPGEGKGSTFGFRLSLETTTVSPPAA